MTTSDRDHRPDAPSPSDGSEASPSRMRRVGFASFIGTVVEFYDFNIYGTAAALVFPRLFFPALGTAAGTVASFATLGVAFVARPLGSVLFGHFGDRLGRKRTLVATMLTMGIATLLVGLMPTAAAIGVAAPILLVLLRVLQGVAAGGEWAGAALFSAESAPAGRRGFWAMMPSLGGGVAVMLGAATFLATGLGMSDEAFLSYGWRIPFLASIVLLGIGLWIRLATEETPVFTRQQAVGSRAAGFPVVEAFRRQPREIVLGAGVEIMAFALLYLGVTYLTSYGTTELELSRTAVLGVNIAGGAGLCAGILVGGVTSDRVGRRRVLLLATSLAVVWSLLLFPVLDLGSVLAFGVGIVVSTFVAGLGFGPVGAMMSELFATRYRYTASGICYNVAGIVGGAVPPLLAAAIIAAFGSLAFGAFLAILCLVSLLCCAGLPETRHFALDREPADSSEVGGRAEAVDTP